MERQSSEIQVKTYRLVLTVAGLMVVAHAAARVLRQPFDARWLVFAASAVVGSRVTSSRMPGVTDVITVSDTFIFLTALLCGPDAGILVAAVATAGDSARHVKRPAVIALNIAAICCSFFASGLLVGHTFGDLARLAHRRETFFTYAAALALFAGAQTVVNLALVFFPRYLQTGQDLPRTWREGCAQTAVTTTVTYFTGAATAAIVNALVHYYGFWAVGSLVPLVVANYLIYRPYIKNVEDARRHAEETEALHLRTLEAFAAAVDAKDQITHEHVQRVQVYAEGMARLLGLSEPEIRALQAGALLHDIGKLAVPDYILNKPGKLTAAEFDKMKIHTVVGAQILERINFPYPLVPVVRHHHERWDGRGYPDGLKGEEIPLTARILTVVDCFDAVREDRQYRKGMTREEAVALIRRDRGTFYDPRIVDLFIEHLPQFEEQIARLKQGQRAFTPVAVEETEAIRRATPAAGLAFEKPAEAASEQPEYVHTILAAHQASQEFIALYEIAQTFTSTLDVRDTLAITVNKLERIVPFDTCVVYLLDDDSPAAVARHAVGAHAESFRGRAIRPGEGVTGWVLANHHPFSNTDPTLDLMPLGVSGVSYRTLAVYPLLKGAQLFGALAIYSQKLESYSPDHLHSLERVAALTSDAIHNALVHAETRRRAATDALTGLPNARALEACIERELGRESGRDAGTGEAAGEVQGRKLLLIDLNDFRAVNAALGHEQGDELLKEVGRVIQAQLRQGDYLFRYAGDEFVALLDGVAREQLAEVALRIESAVAALAAPGLAAGGCRLSVSMGQAEVGRDGAALEEVLEAAERRLQADKAARRSLAQLSASPAR
jgi:diguanylate cyclase (GGDEF)-like protein/putative nucleotidyltransferase with HDIG domain